MMMDATTRRRPARAAARLGFIATAVIVAVPFLSPSVDAAEIFFPVSAPRIDGLRTTVTTPGGDVEVVLHIGLDERGRSICAGDCTVDGVPVDVKGKTLLLPDGDVRLRFSARGRDASGAAVSLTLRGTLRSNTITAVYRGPRGKATRDDCPLAVVAEENLVGRLELSAQLDCRGRIAGEGAITTGLGNDVPQPGRLKGRLNLRRGLLKWKLKVGRRSVAFRGVLDGDSYRGVASFRMPPERSARPFDVPFAALALPFDCPERLNRRPLADAGPDAEARVGQTAELDGRGSIDGDGDPLTYRWRVVSRPPGSTAAPDDPEASTPAFTPDRPGEYVLELVVGDGKEESERDTAGVATINSPPVADAGPDLTLRVGERAVLDGSASTDVDGDVIVFSWALIARPDGSAAALDDPTSPRPGFLVDRPGAYIARLSAGDGILESLPDIVTVTTENSRPVADAGDGITTRVGVNVRLDGTRSSDIDGDPIAFSWELIARPEGSAAALDDPGSPRPGFLVDGPGAYVARLTVTDGLLESEPDFVAVTTENSPPVADAGDDLTARVTDTVRLDGTGSRDVDGDPITFSWALIARPDGSAAALDDATSPRPGFLVDRPGSYVAQLAVSDGALDGELDTVTVTTENSPPVADAGRDRVVPLGGRAELDGSGSKDADGDPLAFHWSLIRRPEGSGATLSDPEDPRPTFEMDAFGLYVAQLVVSDGVTASEPDTVAVMTENTAPTADAGPDVVARVTEVVRLDGTGSSDPEGTPLAFRWEVVTRPPESVAEPPDPASPRPEIAIDRPGTYELALVVSDGIAESEPDVVRITTRNSPPVADAGPDLVVAAGTTIRLDGTGSYDVDGDRLHYAWSFISRPRTSNALFSELTVASPTLGIDVPGEYVIRLMVSDGEFDAFDTVMVTAE